MNWYHKRTLGEVLEEAANKFGNRDALIFNDEAGPMRNLIEKHKVAASLSNRRYKRRICCRLDDKQTRRFFLMFAIARVGGCMFHLIHAIGPTIWPIPSLNLKVPPS